MQINNGNENIEVSSKLAKKLTKEDLNAGDTQAVNKAIFESIDKNKDGEITTDELAAMLSTLDTDGDGKVTDLEITAAVDKIENVKAEKKTEYINFLKNMAAKNAEKVANDDNVGNSYVVQLGEQFPDLIKRIMKAQGEKEDDITESSDVYKKYVAQFKADNPNAFKAKDGGDGVSWLYAGVKVYIRTDSQNTEKAYIKDRANVSEVEEDYRNWVSGGKKVFTYNAEKPDEYRQTRGKGNPVLNDASVDFEVLSDTDYGSYNQEKVQEKVNKAIEFLNKLKDKSNVEKTEYKDKQVIMTLKDGGTITLVLGDDYKVESLWIDIDKEKGKDGKTHSEIALKTDGSLLVNMDNDEKTDLTIKKDDLFDFNDISKLGINGNEKLSQFNKLALRTTFGTPKGWFYSNDEKCHYRWCSTENKFIKFEGITDVNNDGVIKRGNDEYALRDTYGAEKGLFYAEKEQCHYKYNFETKEFERHPEIKIVNKDGSIGYYSKEEQVGRFGLRETEDKNHKKIYYYSDSEKMHYKWDGNKFIKQPNVDFIGSDGRVYTK